MIIKDYILIDEPYLLTVADVKSDTTISVVINYDELGKIKIS